MSGKYKRVYQFKITLKGIKLRNLIISLIIAVLLPSCTQTVKQAEIGPTRTYQHCNVVIAKEISKRVIEDAAGPEQAKKLKWDISEDHVHVRVKDRELTILIEKGAEDMGGSPSCVVTVSKERAPGFQSFHLGYDEFHQRFLARLTAVRGGR